MLEPFAINRTGDPTFVVIRIRRVHEAGPFELDEFRDQIRSSLRQQKQLDGFIAKLRRNAYIKVTL